MRLTTKGRFAVTAMIDLALRQNNGPVTLAAISQRQQISLSYLEQLFGKLRRHELVEAPAALAAAIRWPQGRGHHRGRHHRRGGRAHRCHQLRRQGKLHGRSRPLHDARAVGRLNAKMIEYLDSVTLRKLVDEQLAKGVRSRTRPSAPSPASRWSSPSA
jgi:Rrf2 family iron-sulfur cluster assembly transcriptional regulator